MESPILSAVSDDREEGEIVDDDFEDISDNSIIVPINSGKSVSSKEHLPAISLSSVTEVDEPKTEEKVRHRQKIRKKTSKLHKKKRNTRRRSTTYNDSDSDDYLDLDRKLQNQLKAAVRVDDIEEKHKNSLRSRLKGMTKLDNDSDNSVEKNDNNEKVEHKEDQVEHKDSSDDGDTELTQLRLEALRTAVLNKFMHRKKRKMKEMQDNDVLSDISIRTDTSETNKENNHKTNENVQNKIEENPAKKLCVVEKPVESIENKIEITNNIVVENITPPEEDEDVLRALLLASMSKKITIEAETKKPVTPPVNNNIVKKTWASKVAKSEVKTTTTKNSGQFKNRIVKKNIVTIHQAVPLPQVKPLIIKVNGDSDSDDDAFSKVQESIANGNVKLKPIDIEIENTVERFLKEQRAKVEAQLPPVSKAPPKINNSVILEKSSVKLLPKVKQLEYQKLLQKLKNAEKRPRVRRVSNKAGGEGKVVGITAKKLVRTKVLVNKPVNKMNISSKLEQPDIRTEARTLHKMLKEMQIQKNGRLQIQEKYKVLMPIVKKINEASTERKKCDEEVKRLFDEWMEAKKKLLKCQQTFSAHVKELIGEKEAVDKSLRRSKPVIDPKNRFTSTPIKEKQPIDSLELSSVKAATPDQTLQSIPTVEPSPLISSPKAGETEEEVIEAPLNPGDPNDIDKIYSKQKSSYPRYISPLDSVKRVANDDPFSIVCPYDVDGNCRDPECVYKHLFK